MVTSNQSRRATWADRNTTTDSSAPLLSILYLVLLVNHVVFPLRIFSVQRWHALSQHHIDPRSSSP